MSTMFVTLGGLLAIAAIIWWFWLSGPKAARATGSHIEIRVEGGTYQPAVIAVPAGRPITLRFLRIDATPCAEKVVFADLAIHADLPLGKPCDVALPALPKGTHEFTCQMGMYRGKLVAQ